ncbi:MAG TPA: DUF481 domain-containing protein [Vicinamibacterales bacterium]|nr:DUF481 domain-containing protein [Vicinamibacterales bacterium]
MRTPAALLLLALCFGPGLPQSVSAQSTGPQTPATAPAAALLRVFLDCNECDFEFLRQNVGFVDYVRDRNVAEVHVLVTTQGTGGGGQAWTLKFIGLGRFANQDRTLSFNTGSTATSDERRREFARVFKLGVVGYAADSSAQARLNVTFEKGETESKPTKDPWHNWVFNVSGGGNLNGEQVNKSRSFNASVSASRTTEQWKMNLSADRNARKSTFDIDDSTRITSRQNSWSVNGLIVKSLNAKWSLGGKGDISHSSFSNNDQSVTAAPGIEFDFFPYRESSRRSLTIQYTMGATRYDYRELTIYDKLSETVPHHAINASLGLRQPWGSVSASADLTQHLNHRDRWRSSVFGSADVRVFKGFSFNIFANYSKIKDQIGLPKSDVSTEEILLQIRQLHTNYSYFMGFNINYSFGSIYNSIVNPRFGGGGGHMFFCC